MCYEHPVTRSPLLHWIELLAWAGLLVVAVMTLASTASADFPARTRALMGEGVVLAIALLLGVLSWRRVQTTKATSGWEMALVAVRLVTLMPTLLFALLVSAAGFAA